MIGKGGANMAKPKYESAEEMQKIIDTYFEECVGSLLTDKNGQPVFDKAGRPILIGARPPTMTGLAAALGFRTRKSLCDYKRKGDFEQVILTARLRIENYAEIRLFDTDGVRGAMFTLAVNFGWGKKIEGKHRTSSRRIVLTDLSGSAVS